MTTIYDVAKHAGVSAMTVSRVLNDSDRVAPASQAKVNQSIHALGYKRNEAARALVTNKTGIIKLKMSVALRGNHPYFSQLFAGITDVLSKHRLAMLVANKQTDTVACDGTILMGLTRVEQNTLKPMQTPSVLFGQGTNEIDWIDVDNTSGSQRATDHLISLGHRRIGFLKFHTPEPFINDRESGFREAMHSAGLAVSEDWVVSGLQNSFEDGYRSAQQLLQEIPDLTALVCSSDPIASGALEAARQMGYRIPEDLSITGFDGVGEELRTHPVLTTVRQPVFDIGSQLASLLVARIKKGHNSNPTQQLIHPELIPGGSTSQTSRQ